MTPIQHHLGPLWADFQNRYNSVMDSPIPILNDVNSYNLKNGGKQIRPTLLLLSAAASGNIHPHLSDLAVAVELLHNASLMHDDVVDQDDERRGQPSIHKKWNSPVAILTGDYYLAQVMHLILSVENPAVCDLLTKTVTAMTEGELIQQAHLNDAVADTDLYLDIIGRKTASLMSACCAIGAIAPEKEHSNTNHTTDLFQSFGMHYGTAFQLRDDINDYHSEHNSTRPPIDTLYTLLKKEIELGNDIVSLLPQNQYTTELSTLLIQLQ